MRADPSANVVRLGDVCKIQRKVAITGANTAWLLNLDKIEQQTGRVLEYEYLPLAEMGQSTIPFDATVVLYSKLRPNLNKVVVPDQAGFATSELVPLVPDSGRLSREYLAAYLRSTYFVSWAVSKVAGAKMPRLSPRLIMEAAIPLPSLSRQHEISTALDRICALKRNAEAQLDQLKLLAKSRFVEMFGACKTLVQLDQIGKIFTGATPPMKHAEYYESDDFCFVKPSDLSYDITMVTESESHVSVKAETVARMFNPGAVLVTCIGATIGKMGVARIRGTCNQQINFIEPSEQVNPIYLAHALRSRKEALVASANTTAVPILNKSDFSKFKITLPSIELQCEYAAFIEQLDKSLFAVKKLIEQYDLLYRAKLQEYFG